MLGPLTFQKISKEAYFQARHITSSLLLAGLKPIRSGSSNHSVDDHGELKTAFTRYSRPTFSV